MSFLPIYPPGKIDPHQVASRPRESPYPMFSVDEAVAMVMENTPILDKETVDIKGCICTDFFSSSVFVEKIDYLFHRINYLPAQSTMSSDLKGYYNEM